MSKKNNKNQQQPSKPAKQQFLQLANLKVAEKVTVTLPKDVSVQQINQAIMNGYIRSKLINKKIKLGQSFILLYLGIQRTFLIENIDNHAVSLPEQGQEVQIDEEETKVEQGKDDACFIFGQNTILLFKDHENQKKNTNRKVQKFGFFGFQQQLKQLIESVNYSLFKRQQLIQNGLGPINGILISGYSGAGKSAILHEAKERILQKDERIYWKSISSIELLSKVVGGAEQFIRSLFQQLKKQSPAVLTIEDIHLVFGQKQSNSHQTTLAALLGSLQALFLQKIVVLATYNTDRELNRNMRASGKFEKQITLSMPNHHSRLNILEGLVSKLKLQVPLDRQGLKRANLKLNGFSVGQIKQIIRQCFSRYGAKFTTVHLDEALKKYRPAEIKELIVEVPQVRWTQIGGYEKVKKQIKKVVELPLTYSDKFIKFGIEPSKGILLYGPPGCSKTMMAKAIATQCGLNFIGIKGPQLFSKYVGDSEKAIRNIFKRARACSPCVIFFDEIDAIASQRSANTQVSDRVLCQLLNEMDGIQGLREVAIVAATNRPQILDKALMRPGRFDYLIYVSPPDLQARIDIFSIYLTKSSFANAAELSKTMAERTQNYTGAQISLICREAVMIAIEEDINIETISLKHLQLALTHVKKRVTADLIARYQMFSSTIRQ